MKIGILSSGIPWQDFGFRHLSLHYDSLYIYGPRIKWNNYDIIIVPRGIHQQFLLNERKRILDFLKRGGILISFGEADSNWIPNTHWAQGSLWQKTKIVKENDLFSGVSERDLRIWTKATHGCFDAIPQGATILAVVKEDPKKVLMFLDRSMGGVLLATTLDPDVHIYSGDSSAIRLAENTVKWAASELLQRFQRKKGRLIFLEPVLARISIILYRLRPFLMKIVIGIIGAIVVYLIKLYLI